MTNISKKLIEWYLTHKRDLPWRKTTDPYKIWLSEIMLQQTQVAQGLPYYVKFLDQFSTVKELADATEEEVLKLWQGLGYYSRARNLHATAQHVAYNLNGVFPDNYKDLKTLKGVGDYTASAIASICYQEPKAVLDGNVFRVLARLYGIATPINSSEGQKCFSKLAQDLLDKKNPDTNNQAIMEFGARHCKPKQPLCEACVFVTHCVAYQTGKVSELPVKQKKIKLKTRYFNYIVCISNSGQTLLNKRTEKGIWANLYEFPLIETDALADYDELYSAIEQSSFSVNTFELLPYNIDSIVHKLSHQHIYTRFWILKTDEYLKAGIPVSDITKYPVPVLIANFIKAYSF